MPVAATQFDAFLQAFEHSPRALFPGATELLAALAPRYRLASVSNTNELRWTYLHERSPVARQRPQEVMQ